MWQEEKQMNMDKNKNKQSETEKKTAKTVKKKVLTQVEMLNQAKDPINTNNVKQKTLDVHDDLQQQQQQQQQHQQ